MDTLELPCFDPSSELEEAYVGDDLPDAFESHYRDDLLNLYLALREMASASGLPFFRDATFSKFCDFVKSTSTRENIPPPLY